MVIDGFYRVEPWYLCLLQLKFYDNCITAEQQQWLQADLQWASNNADIDHVFVFMHEGPYSSKEGRTGSQQIRELLPLFADHKVKIVFSGHDHYYEHGKTGNGLHYVITGGGGAPLYKTGDNIWNVLFPHDILMSESVHNYQVVEVDGDYIKVTTHNVDAGNVLEEFEIGSKTPCNTVADCAAEEPGSCLGNWECKTYGCSWTCDPAPEPDACLTPADCGSDPGGACSGDWECPIGTFKCVWVCDGNGQCSTDNDCAGAEPLNSCQGGAWKCEPSANVCEWHCEGPAQVPDAGAEPVPDAAPDAPAAEPMPDASGPDPAPEPMPEQAAPDAAVADADAGSPTPPDATTSTPDASGGSSDVTTNPDTGSGSPQAGETSDGCAGAAAPAHMPWWWILFLVGALGVVRSRRRQATLNGG